ncbi:hypothetical protein D3C77_620160 [compost metagenome]
MALHRLVHIHSMHAGCVEPSQPHVTDDHQPERVAGVLKAFLQDLLLQLVIDVRLQQLAVGR